MNSIPHPFRHFFTAASLAALAAAAPAAAAADAPYQVVKTAQSTGAGRIDYVFADSDNRRLYVPRGGQVLVFNLDTLESAGSIPNAQAHGVAVDSKSNHGFCSSNPVVMWDAKTLQTIKTIALQGGPDAIAFEPLTERIYVLSHRAPNVTVLDGKDGSIVGTIDLGGAPEQAVSDGQGHIYINIEDKSTVAVVDVNSLKVTARYELGKGEPAGMGLDAKNRIIFAFCQKPSNCVVLNADDGKILATLPIGNGNDSACFNPNTLEAFGSQGDGTLAVVKESSPTSFAVAQTVQTKSRAKTCTLDAKKDQVVLIATEPAPGAGSTPAGTPAAGSGQGADRPHDASNQLDILVVGRP